MSWKIIATLGALAGIAMGLSNMANAEQMFIDDKLILNVYSQPDQSSEKIATLESGDSIEMLETLDSFALVRMADGVEGWVGENYLTREPPAAVRLQKLEGELKTATQKAQKQAAEKFAKLEEQNASLQSEIEQLKQAAQAVPTPEPVPAPAPVERVAMTQASAVSGFNTAWVWAPMLVLVGALSYAAGYQTLARRIRNKFGGVKIY